MALRGALGRASLAGLALLCLLGLTACTSRWGALANPGYEGQPIKTILFFAGQPLDGTTISANRCGQSPEALFFYSVHPLDPVHLEWRNPINRLHVLDEIVADGFNTLSMSTWGESWLPCTTPCPNVPEADCGGDPTRATTERRCSRDPRTGEQVCRIGWYGSAPMQISPAAKDELFDAALAKPILIMPFIESRFGFDWDFHDEFPRTRTGELAPGLISQIKDLIAVYLQQPRDPHWPAKWAQVFDKNGEPRYALVIVQAASDVLGPNEDEAFAAGFDAVADKIVEDTGVKIGFFIDPIPRNPTSTLGCSDVTNPVSTYGASFKPDPIATGPYLREQDSILGIHAYSPEGWIDGQPGEGREVNECFKLAWKKQWSQQWRDTGIPFLQDVTPGYDGTKLFEDDPSHLLAWGNNAAWRAALLAMVQTNGRKGMVYNSWNGYSEGLAGMPTLEYQQINVDWIRKLTATYNR
jgi:hypothetical protein